MSDEINVTERILNTLEKIDDAVRETQLDVASTKGDITAIKVDLNYHVMRTNLAEQNIEQLRLESDVRLKKLEKWSDKFHFLGWLVAGVVSIAEVGIRVFDYFKH